MELVSSYCTSCTAYVNFESNNDIPRIGSGQFLYKNIFNMLILGIRLCKAKVLGVLQG